MISPLIKHSSIPLETMIGAELILRVAAGSSYAPPAVPPLRPQSTEIAIALPDEGLGEVGATFLHKVDIRRNAGSHPQGIVAGLKLRSDQTAVLPIFYNGEIAIGKNQTGQP